MQPPSVGPRASFELLCLLRALYRRRGPLDSVSVLSVDAAILYAETMLVFSRPSVTVRAPRSADSTV
jgi:hypothetical protein